VIRSFCPRTKQHRQELEGLFLKPYSQTVPAQFVGAEIQFEPKMEPPAHVIVL
jgi:hypothetical protein